MRPTIFSFTMSILWTIHPGAASAQETLYSPGSTTHQAQVRAQAKLVSELAANHRRSHEVQRAHEKGFMDTLHQVEKAAVPVPDDPPIRYPSVEKWRQVTARRRDDARPSRLTIREAAERRIDESLRSPTEFDFVEVPLAEVIEYLKDLHGVEIQIDGFALAKAGIGTDTPITRELKGISLRSALRLMLRDLGLIYVVRDEVLLITSQEEAGSHREIKVYPVGDLMLPRLRPVSRPCTTVPYCGYGFHGYGHGSATTTLAR